MSAEEFYPRINSLGEDGQPLLVQIYVTLDLLAAHEPQAVKQQLGEEAWTQAHGLVAARSENN